MAAGRGKLLSWWEDMIGTDPLIHFDLQKIWLLYSPKMERKHAQDTHAWSAFGPEETDLTPWSAPEPNPTWQ